MIIRNLTPHIVNLPGLTIAPSGPPARVQETPYPAESVEVALDDSTCVQVRRYRVVTHMVTGLPPAKPGVLLIVSRMIAERFAGKRDDLVFPYYVTKAKGRPDGCRALGFPNAPEFR